LVGKNFTTKKYDNYNFIFRTGAIFTVVENCKSGKIMKLALEHFYAMIFNDFEQISKQECIKPLVSTFGNENYL
jgi:hypothetical protein